MSQLLRSVETLQEGGLRILVVDDEPLIQYTLRRLLLSGLGRKTPGGDDPAAENGQPQVEVNIASQGQEALVKVKSAVAEGQHYALAFVDVRMAPGWDGVETTKRLWAVDPDLQVVICTAHTDYSWSDIVSRLGASDSLLVLKKPFDAIEVLQLAQALTRKWLLNRRARYKMSQLERMAKERTRALEQAYEDLGSQIAERHRMEVELRNAHKLEAVGQLAAGIAHELNTPAQFVGDNIRLLQESFEDLRTVLEQYDTLLQAVCGRPGFEALARIVAETCEEAQLDFIKEQIPMAITGAMDGFERISKILRGMRHLAYPDQREKVSTDINNAIAGALAVARPEYRDVAEVETDFSDVPLVRCHIGDMSQVFLNLIVNAAQAIAERMDQDPTKGRIVVTTRSSGNDVLISIRDNGCGIPEAVRDRIFEPFFTTNEDGSCTGQGLAVAHSSIVKYHGGSINFESVEGEGTTFFVRLPIDGDSA